MPGHWGENAQAPHWARWVFTHLCFSTVGTREQTSMTPAVGRYCVIHPLWLVLLEWKHELCRGEILSKQVHCPHSTKDRVTYKANVWDVLVNRLPCFPLIGCQHSTPPGQQAWPERVLLCPHLYFCHLQPPACALRKTTEVPSQVNHTASLSVKGQNGSVLLQEQEQQRQNPPGPGSASWVQGLNTAHLGHLLGSFLEAELLYFFKYFIFKIGHGLWAIYSEKKNIYDPNKQEVATVIANHIQSA